MLGLIVLSLGQTARLLVQSAPSPSPARPQDQDRPCGRPVARRAAPAQTRNAISPAGRHLPELGFACAKAEGSPLFTHQATPSPGFDTCNGALAAYPSYVFDSACGPYESRAAGTGQCASSACAALVDSFTDAKVEQMATGFASCTHTEQGVLKYAQFGDVEYLKDTIRHYVSPCGLTAPFTPLRFDTCIRERVGPQHGAFAMPLVRLRRPRVWNGGCISRTR